MNRFRKYVVPALLSALMIFGLLTVGAFYAKEEKKKNPAEEVVTLPHGRVLYVVCEAHGAYVGEEFVHFPDFDQFIRDRSRVFSPDYLIVMATADSRYGDVAAVFASLHRATNVPGTIETRPVPHGTRRPVIAVRERFWQY